MGHKLENARSRVKYHDGMDEDEARERILATAERLYYERGYGAVGMDALRTEAGVSLRRLYGLFPSKENIVAAVLARRRVQWEDALAAKVDLAGEDRRARMLAVFDHLAEWFVDPTFRGCAFLRAWGELSGTDEQVAQIVRDHKAAFQSTMVELVGEDVAGGELLAAQLSLLAEGAQSTAAIAGEPSAAAHARAAAEVLVDHALAA